MEYLRTNFSIQTEKPFHVNATILQIYLDLNESKFLVFSIDIPGTEFKFTPETNTVRFSLSGLTMHYDLYLILNSDPLIIFGDGNGNVTSNNLALNMDVEFFKQLNRNFNITFKNMETNLHTPETFDMMMHSNNNDLFVVVNMIMQAVLPFLRKQAGGVLSPDLLATLTDMVNDVFSGMPPSLPIPVSEFFKFDYGLQADPQINSDGFLMFSLNGTFFNETSSDIPFPMPDDLPTVNPSGYDMQLFLSQYTLNSALWGLQQEGFFAISVETSQIDLPIPIDTDFIGE